MTSKSEAKRLAVMQRATWFATCECTGPDAVPDYFTEDVPGATATATCRACDTPYVPVPHVVEDRIRAGERARQTATCAVLRDDREMIRRALVVSTEAMKKAEHERDVARATVERLLQSMYALEERITKSSEKSQGG